VNAIVHGNQEDPHKRVYVRCRCTADGEVSITVEDEGNGFEPDAIPDPTSPDNRLRTHGRGIYLIRTLMDEVRYEQGGSVVHMRKNPTGKPSAQGENPMTRNVAIVAPLLGPSRPLLNSVTRLLLLSLRHFAEHAAAILGLSPCFFSGFGMASQLHCSLASLIKKRRTTSSDYR
jgi:serine/threonine-protein kinase RsbW